MKTIVEKLQELEFQNPSTVDEGLADFFKSTAKKVKDKISFYAEKIKNRVLMFLQDGTLIAATSPITSGLAIQSGDAGKSTFIIPKGSSFSSFGVKGNSKSEILADFKRTKRSIFESVAETAGVMESEFPTLSLSGEGKYGQDVNASQLKKLIGLQVKLAGKVAPLMIWGAPGIGKTSIVQAFIEEFAGKKTLIIKNLAQCEKDDFSLPAFEDLPTGGRVVTEVPKTWLPMYKHIPGDDVHNAAADNIANGATKEGEIGEGGIIFFDELARCNGDVQAVALSLIQDRELVGYRLGSKWSIIAASNREADDPETSITLSKALGNRFTHVNYVPVFKEWKAWAEKKGYMNKDVLRFIEFNNKYWYFMHPDNPDEKLYASPRSWEACCKMLAVLATGLTEDGVISNYNLENVDPEDIRLAFNSNMQSEVTDAFLSYYDMVSKIDVDKLKLAFTNPEAAPNLTKNNGKTIDIALQQTMIDRTLSELENNKSKYFIDMEWEEEKFDSKGNSRGKKAMKKYLPKPEYIENWAKWLCTAGDSATLVSNAMYLFLEMFKRDGIQNMLGFEEQPNYDKKTGVGQPYWDAYVHVFEILEKGCPGLSKDLSSDIASL